MKDPQREKVYQAEWGHSAYSGRRDFRSVRATERWANQIVGSAWFGKAWPHMAHHPVTIFDLEDSTLCTAFPVNNTIDMASWGWRKIIVCHELAHLCNVDSEHFQIARAYADMGRRKKKGAASHGKKFCTIYLKIVKGALGKEAARELKRNFDLLGVQYEKRSKRRCGRK